MTRTGNRHGLILLAAVLLVSLLLPLGDTIKASAAMPGTSRQPSTSKQHRIKVLTAALANMRKHYKKLANSLGPADVFDYQVGALWRRGIDGTGTTVAVIEGWDDPGIGNFMRGFDKALGLPAARIKTIFPTGDHKLPATCPPGMVALGSYGSCSGWKGELELDVLSVHVMAPYAKILITVAPADSEITDDAASQVAPPEMMQAVEYLSRHHLANVISISDGTAESTYSHGREELTAQDAGELTAAAAGIPLLVATGDCDAAQHLAVADSTCTPASTTRGRATAAWDDSPWVTAVGGSTPNLNATGHRVGLDPVWNIGPFGEPFGEGAGFSAVFAKPGYQAGIKVLTGSSKRSVPDITMDASDGTSEAAPLLAGVLALATQANHGKNVGPINNALYGVLGPHGLKDGIADVVQGNNSVYRNSQVVLKGFTATTGFDVASGWGTIRADSFVPSLAAATQAADQDRAVRSKAAAALLGLEHQVTLSAGNISTGGSARMSAGGFLPLHPVTLLIDNHTVMVLHADTHGAVSFVIHPAALGLSAGNHTLTLISMLLTSTKGFRTH